MGALLSILNEFLYSYILIALLLVAGLYFTFRTRFVQFRLFKEGIQLLSEKSHKQGGVSSFQALMISTASRVRAFRKNTKFYLNPKTVLQASRLLSRHYIF